MRRHGKTRGRKMTERAENLKSLTVLYKRNLFGEGIEAEREREWISLCFVGGSYKCNLSEVSVDFFAGVMLV